MSKIKKIYVTPKNKNILVPNPDNQFKPLNLDGEYVDYDRYWNRRIKDGDVVLSKKKPKTVNTTSKK